MNPIGYPLRFGGIHVRIRDGQIDSVSVYDKPFKRSPLDTSPSVPMNQVVIDQGHLTGIPVRGVKTLSEDLKKLRPEYVADKALRYIQQALRAAGLSAIQVPAHLQFVHDGQAVKPKNQSGLDTYEIRYVPDGLPSPAPTEPHVVREQGLLARQVCR